MTSRIKRYLFDSFALLKFFQKEPGHEKVRDLIKKCCKSNYPHLISAINLGEIIYNTKRHFGDERKMEVLMHTERMDFNILPVSNNLIFRAAEFKADHAISYADCIALATALEEKAIIVTGDPEFKKVADFIEIEWI